MRYAKLKILCLTLVIIVGTLLGMTADCAAAASSGTQAEDERFEVSMTCGLNGYSKYNSYMPINLTITNNGDDFSGHVRIIFDSEGYSADRTAFTKQFLAAAGETRQVSLTVPDAGISPIFTMVIEDDDGNVLYNKRVRTSIRYTNDLYVGMLTSDFNGLNYMDGIPFWVDIYNEYSSLRIFKMDESTMPDSGTGLDNLDVLIINDFDTSLLSQQQYSALKMWVSNGGILLIGTGANYKKTLSLFKDDYLTGTTGSVIKAETDFGLTGFTATHRNVPLKYEEESLEAVVETNEDGSPVEESVQESDTMAEAEGADVKVAQSTSEDAAVYVDETAEEMYDVMLSEVAPLSLDSVELSLDGSEEHPEYLCQAVRKGSGTVYVFSFDLGSEPFRSWEYNADAIQNFFRTLTDVEAKGQLQSSSLDGYYVQDMLSNYIAEKLPGISRYVAIIAIYILLISPIAYMILRKLDKRHLIWGTVTIMACICTVCIFLFGSSTRQKNPYLNYGTILTIDSNKAVEKTYFSATSPSNRGFSFDVADNYLVSPLAGGSYYYNSNMLFGDGQRNDDSSYDMNLTYGSGKTTIDVENIRAFGSKYMVAQRESDITGDVDIQLSYVIDHFEGTVTNNTGYYLEDTFLKLGNSLVVTGNLADGESVTIDQSTPMLLNMTYYEIPDSIYNSGDTNNRDAVRHKMLRSYMQGTRNAYYLSTTLESTYQFTGFVANYPVNLADASGLDCAGQVLINKSVNINYTKDGEFYVPNIFDGCKVLSGDIDGVDYYFYSDEVILECYVPSQLSQVTQLTLANPGVDLNAGKDEDIIYYLYNWEDAKYEQIFVEGSRVMDTNALDGYIQNNIMRVRLEKVNKNNYNSVMLPVLSLSGR